MKVLHPYCDQLVKEGKPLVRKAVVDALVAQGLNPATVSTAPASVTR